MQTVTGAILALIFFAAPAAAVDFDTQNSYSRTSWTAKDGLPGNSVWNLTQDGDGYLWVGTNVGLARFDGVRFTTWDPPGGAPKTGVAAFYPDSDGSLWVSWAGMARVDHLVRGHATSYLPRDGLADGVVLALQGDVDGVIWAGGRGGLCRFRKGHWEQVQGFENARPITTIFKDRGGVLWFGTPAGVFRHDRATDRFELKSGPAEIAKGFAEDREGSIWTVDPHMVFKNLSTGSKVRPTAVRRSVDAYVMLSDSSGRFWMGTSGSGVFRLDSPNSVAAEQYTAENGLSANSVRTLFEDREGNIWVGTLGGLTRLSEGSVTMLSGRAGSFSGAVQAITAGNDGTMWVGTSSGLYHFSPDRKNRPSLVSMELMNVTALHADSRGSVWIGTRRGLALYANGQLSYVPRTQVLGEISAIATDGDGSVWVCDRTKGIYQWQNNTLTALPNEPELTRRPVSAIYVDSQNRLWLGFFSGAVAVREGGQFRYYPPAGNGLPGGAVVSFLEDNKTVWIAAANGVARADDHNFTTIIQRDLIPGDVSAFIQDRQGALWLGAGHRLLRIDRVDLQKAVINTPLRYTAFDTSDGLQGDPLSGFPNAARDPDGVLWFLTTTGIALVNPSKLVEQQPPPLVAVEQVVADNRTFNPALRLHLSVRPAELSFEYTAPYLTAPGKLRFRHMLEGLDTEWVNDDTNRRTSYARLPPGSYSFRASSSINGTVWSPPNTPVSLVVPAAFYQTRWFTALATAIGLLCLWSLWQIRKWQLDHEFSLVLAERGRMAREIHDTLLQSLVGLSLQLDNISEDITPASPPTKLKERLKRVRRQVDECVVEARDSIWDLRSSAAEGRDFGQAVREAASYIVDNKETREGREVGLDVDVTGTARPIPGEMRRQLLRIEQEAIRNALQHAAPQRIHVCVHYQPDSVRMEVSDDGRGFSFANSDYRGGGHWGLAILRERASQIGGTAKIVSTPGTGTTVEVIAPLGEDRHG